MIRINKNLVMFSGLFLFLGTIVVFILQKFSPLIGHATYYCKSFIDTHMIPIPYYLSIIPIVFVFLILAISLIKFFVLSIKVQFLKYALKDRVTVKNEIHELIKRLGLKDKTVVIKSNEKLAFCFGVRPSKIYISTGLTTHLSTKELEAVLRHEQYHLENQDTLTMIIASITHSLLPFFPILSDLIKKYKIEREIQADKFAVEKVGSSEPLISALKKLLSFPSVKTVALAAIADQDTLEPRIYALVNKHYIKRPFQLKHLLITLFSAFLVGAVIVSPVYATEVHHEDHDVMMVCTDIACMNSCASEKNLNKLYSEIPNSSQPYTPMH